MWSGGSGQGSGGLLVVAATSLELSYCVQIIYGTLVFPSIGLSSLASMISDDEQNTFWVVQPHLQRPQGMEPHRRSPC